MSTVLTVSTSFLVPFRVSIWLLLLTLNWLYWKPVHGSSSFTCYYFPIIALQKEGGMRMTVNWSSKFKMIWVNFIIFVHLKSLPAQNSCPRSQAPWVLVRAETHLRRNWYGLSSYISRENGDHYYIQTRHNDLFSHYNLILGKLLAELPRKGCINTERVNRIVALAPSAWYSLNLINSIWPPYR